MKWGIALGAAAAVYNAWLPMDADNPAKDERKRWGLPSIRGNWTWNGNGWTAYGKGAGGEVTTYWAPCGQLWTINIPQFLSNFSAYTYWCGARWYAEDPIGNPTHKGRDFSFTLRAGQYGLPSNVPLDDHGLWPLEIPFVAPDQKPANYVVPGEQFVPARAERPVPVDVGFVDKPGIGFVPSPPHGRPPPRVPERKYQSYGKLGVVLWAVSQSTEALDFWNAILDAAGWQYQKKWFWAGHWYQRPDWTPSRIGQQIQFVADGGLEGIDWKRLFGNLIGNQVEDFIFGKFSSSGNEKILDAWNKMGLHRPVGIGAGPAM